MSDNENRSPANIQDEDPIPTDIDTELLIAEVKKRPFLYKKSYTEFIERETSQQLWQEVCQATIEDWNVYDAEKKKEKVKEVQATWCVLKDSYLQVFGGSDKLEPPNKKIRKQVNYESLSFLIPPMADTAENINSNGSKLELVMNTKSDQKSQDNIMVSPSPQNALSSSEEVTNLKGAFETAEAGQPEQPLFEEPISSVQEFVPAVQEPIPPDQLIIKPPVQTPMSSILEEPKEESICENTHFCLMLVPMMRKFNDEQRYYARTEILRIMNQVSQIEQNQGPKRISILQNELKYADTQVESGLLADTNYPLAEDPGCSSQEDHTYPAPLPRPRNEKGELQFPETDSEDEVDV